MTTPAHKLRRTLVFHNAVLAELRQRYQNLSSEREKQLFSKIMAGKILKKYRLLTMAKTEFGFSAKRKRNNEKTSAALTYIEEAKQQHQHRYSRENQAILGKRRKQQSHNR